MSKFYPKSLTPLLIVAGISLGSTIPSRAAAQETDKFYTFCSVSVTETDGSIHPAESGIFLWEELRTYSDTAVSEQFRSFIQSKSPSAKVSPGGCIQRGDKNDADRELDMFSTDRFGNQALQYSDWRPQPSAPVGPSQTFTLAYSDGERAGYGYRSASIKLSYRFLLCADEIQVAYGLDRKSQQHGEQYVVHPSGGGNFEYATPASEPPVPLALPINLSVVRKATGAHVAKLVDANAGESLGSGCVTGQTRKIGTAAALVGANPTRAQIQDYLNSLTLRGQDTDGGATLDLPLTNPDIPVPASARIAPKPPTHAPARRAAPRKH